MWFATGNGLFRFDGTNVLYARQRLDDSAALPSNDVNSVTGDKLGNIYVGTSKGAVIVDPNTLVCTRLRESNGNWPGYKFKCFADEDGTVWAINDVGLYQFDKEKKNLKLVWAQMKNGDVATQAISSIATYNKDELVAGTLGDIVFINKKDFSSHRLNILPGNAGVDVSKVYVDANKQLWVCTWGFGLLYYDKASQSFKTFQVQKNIPADAYNVLFDIVKVTISNKSFLYIGAPGGLIKAPLQKDGVSPIENAQAYYIHKPDTEGSIPAGSIYKLYPAENDNLWIGSNGDIGVAKIELSESLLYTLPVKHEGNVQDIDQLSAAGKKYYAICSWHGSTGLVLLDEGFNQLKAFDKVPADADHDGVNVSSVGLDKENRFWVSSWKGVTVMDKDLHVVRVLDHRTKGPDTLYREKNNFLLISNDTVWIASYKRGIDLFTTGFKRLKHYSIMQDNGLLEDLIWKFYRAHDGKIWLLGNAFLYSYDAARDRFIPYRFSKDGAPYGPVDIAEKKDGSLLMAAATGLISFKPGDSNYTYLRSPLLDKEDNVNAVSVDENDNAWYLTDDHLVYYNFSSNVYTIYGKQDGLDVSNGLYMMRYVGNNKVLIGQYNKLTIFTAPQSSQQNRPPGLAVTGIYVNDSLFNSSLPAKGLHLSYNQNKINIAFACINYNRPEQNIYAYRLKNADTAWTYTRQGNVTYANLSPGQYTFEVKAANFARVWSKVSAFQVNISPPFWQSWWFRILVLAIAVSATYVVFKWRVNNIRKEEKIKTDLNRKMAQLEMKALRAQMNPHFVFNSLSSIQESIVTGKTEAASKYLSKFSKLIRLILENSGKQFISLKTEIESLTLYLELESFRFENFTYTFSIDPHVDANFTMIPSMVIQPFVENALKHGLSKKKDDKHLKIDIRKDSGRLVAVVEDNGVGRSKATEMKSDERKDHHSMGIKITEERLQLLGVQSNAATEITDLYDKQGNAAGTLVKIILPEENV